MSIKTIQLLHLAMRAHASGHMQEARSLYAELLKEEPKNFQALGWLGTIEASLQNYDQAEILLHQSLALGGKNIPDFLNSYASVLLKKRKYDESRKLFEKLVKRNPDNDSMWSNLATCYSEMGNLDLSLSAFQRSILINPKNQNAWLNRGIALAKKFQHEEALGCFEHSIALNPDNADAWNRCGISLARTGRYAEAKIHFDHAIGLWRTVSPTHDAELSSALNNLGCALNSIKLLEEALEAFSEAIKIRPDFAEAWNNQGNNFLALKRYADASSSYSKALEIRPNGEFSRGSYLYANLYQCQWTDLDENLLKLKIGLSNRQSVVAPFHALLLVDDPKLHFEAASIYTETCAPELSSTREFNRENSNKKIKVGYFSPDFGEHAVSYLITGLLEEHDKDTFDIYGFSTSEHPSSTTRNRIRAAFTDFFDVSGKSSREVAELAQRIGIDISVDLGGHTQNGRPEMFSHKISPIQVNYLGYPGTMGANYYQYILADKIVIPRNNFEYFSEKVVWLPNSYQPHDSKRITHQMSSTREALNLPNEGFVFCCFNNTFKITPTTFDSWMRILRGVPESVLWLLEDNPSVSKNLRLEAEARGVSGTRLIFAERTTRGEHLARHKAADLFLDSLPYNAHTTASDALFEGLPLVTCLGQAFAGRVASSLLTSLGLEELITTTQEEYETLAIELAMCSSKLEGIRAKLARNKLSCPLFDTELQARHIEAAYRKMYALFRSGGSPEHFCVEA